MGLVSHVRWLLASPDDEIVHTVSKFRAQCLDHYATLASHVDSDTPTVILNIWRKGAESENGVGKCYVKTSMRGLRFNLGPKRGCSDGSVSVLMKIL